VSGSPLASMAVATAAMTPQGRDVVTPRLLGWRRSAATIAYPPIL
jgi:hypothetical protein